MTKAALPLVALLALAAPASARDSLGVYSNWAAFRDDSPSRCYAIAKPSRQSETQPFASIATWPQKGLRGQLYVRLSRETEEESNPRLTIGDAELGELPILFRREVSKPQVAIPYIRRLVAVW